MVEKSLDVASTCQLKFLRLCGRQRTCSVNVCDLHLPADGTHFRAQMLAVQCQQHIAGNAAQPKEKRHGGLFQIVRQRGGRFEVGWAAASSCVRGAPLGRNSGDERRRSAWSAGLRLRWGGYRRFWGKILALVLSGGYAHLLESRQRPQGASGKDLFKRETGGETLRRTSGPNFPLGIVNYCERPRSLFGNIGERPTTFGARYLPKM